MRFLIIIAVVFIVLDSCIDPFNINNSNLQNVFIVDGEITDQAGPYTVKIFKPLALNDQLDTVSWVRGAAVSFLDEKGNVDATLHEVSPGHYQTDSAYLGVIGKSYQLRFITNDNDEYRSTVEKIDPVADIDSVYFQFIQNEGHYYFDQINTTNGFNITVNSKLLPEQEGRVRWRWNGTYGIRTYPALRTRPDSPVDRPDPPRCSGYKVIGGVYLQYEFPCTCCYCWVTQYSKTVAISDEKFVNNNTISGQYITFVPSSGTYLFDKYYFVLEQLSVSQTVYDFWKKAAEQQNNSSNLFQTPPPPTGGNIQTISGKIQALGIFSASAIKRKAHFITKQDVPYDLILPTDTIRNSCLLAFQYSTTKKPPFW